MTGEFPPKWSMARLQDLAVDPQQDIVDGPFGSSLKANEYRESGIPIIRLQNIDRNHFLEKNIQFISEGKANELSRHSFLAGDIAITKLGDPLGKAAIIPDHLSKGIVVADIVRVRPDPRFVDFRYVAHAVNSPDVSKALAEETKGTTRPRVNLGHIRALRIPVAPFDEQKRIVDKLDHLLARVDGCREHLDRVPLILKRFRQSVLAASMSGQLTADWRGDQSTEGWVSAKLSDFGVVSGGVTKNSRRIDLPLQLKYVTVANVYENELRLGEVGTIGVTEAELSRSLLLANDLLFVEGNGSIDQIGRVALWDGSVAPCVHQNHIIKFRACSELSPRYALFWMMSPRGRDNLKEAAVSTAGLYNLSISKIENLLIAVPTPAEQTEIVLRVETLFAFADRLEARLETARNRAERLIPATLAKAFRGELVPQDPNDEPASVLLERIQATRQDRARVSATSVKRRLRSQFEHNKKTEVAMHELSDIQPDHLTVILKNNGRLASKALYRMAQLRVEDFYEQLRSEEVKGLLREVREGNESYLEAT